MLVEYLKWSQIQAEDDAQLANVLAALNDLVTLPPEKLKEKRYKAYQGNKDEWDLQMLFSKSVVPGESYLSLVRQGCCHVLSDPCFWDYVDSQTVRNLAKTLADTYAH